MGRWLASFSYVHAVGIRLAQTLIWLIWLLSVKRKQDSLCDAVLIQTRCRTGNATEHLVATRDGCATVAHADMRGLDTSRQIYVAGLPSL